MPIKMIHNITNKPPFALLAASTIVREIKLRIMKEEARTVARGELYRAAFFEVRNGFVRMAFKGWKKEVRRVRVDKVRGTTSIFNVLSNRLNISLLIWGWMKMKLIGVFEGRHVARAWGSRKDTILRRNAMETWKKFKDKRFKIRALVEKHCRDEVTRAFYRWWGEWSLYREDKILYLRRIKKLVKSLKPPIRLRMKQAFNLLTLHARTCRDVMERSFMRWRVWHFQCVQRKNAVKRILWKHTRPRHYFRLWIQRIHDKTKVRGGGAKSEY